MVIIFKLHHLVIQNIRLTYLCEMNLFVNIFDAVKMLKEIITRGPTVLQRSHET